jgi:hypothetical protein
MVWSQYIEDGNFDLDVELDENGEVIEDDDTHLNIHDWQSKYSDELWELWDLMNLLIRDAFLEHTLLDKAEFSDFADFCYAEHHEEPAYIYFRTTPQLSYIWDKIEEYIRDANLRDAFMIGATFDHFIDFVALHTSQNNMTIY